MHKTNLKLLCFRFMARLVLSASSFHLHLWNAFIMKNRNLLFIYFCMQIAFAMLLVASSASSHTSRALFGAFYVLNASFDKYYSFSCFLLFHREPALDNAFSISEVLTRVCFIYNWAIYIFSALFISLCEKLKGRKSVSRFISAFVSAFDGLLLFFLWFSLE